MLSIIDLKAAFLTRSAHIVVGVAVASLLACSRAPSDIRFPEGAGVPYGDYVGLLAQASEACRTVRTMEFILTVRGRVGEKALRGRVRGALARPASLRLEGLSPFGAPRFVLSAYSSSATLVLPPKRQVIYDAAPSELLYALTGLTLTPDAFRAVMTGCLVPEPLGITARAYGDNWIAVELEGDATAHIRHVDGVPTILSGTQGPLVLAYSEHVRGLPRLIRAQVDGPMGETDFTARVSRLNVNTVLHSEVFLARPRADFATVAFEEWSGEVGTQGR